MSYTEQLFLRWLPTTWRDRLRRVGESNKAILRGLGWVALFLFLAKVIAAGKEMLVAYHYGTSPVVDGYLFVNNLVQWPASVFFSVISFVLIPYLVRLRANDSTESYQLIKVLVRYAFGIGIPMSILIGTGIWWMIEKNLSGLEGLAKEAALDAVPWLAPTIALSMLSSIYSTWLMSQRRHANTFLEAMPALGIAFCLVFWPVIGEFRANVFPLALGTFAGFMLQAILLSRLSAGMAVPEKNVKLRAHWQGLRGAFSMMLVAQIVFTSSGLIDQFFAVRMGKGVLATLSYAQRVMALVLGLSATVICRGMLPVFSSIGDHRESFSLAKGWAYRTIILGLGGMLLVVLLARPMVGFLFERGAFKHDDTRAVSLLLMILGVQLPFYLPSMVLNQWIGAIRRPSLLIFAALAGFFAKIVSAFVLYDFGAAGLATAIVIMYMATTIFVYMISRHIIYSMGE